MTDRILVGTRKGLFELERKKGAWDIAGTSFLGDPVTAVLATPDATYAALDLGHFGAKLWRRDTGGKWEELAAPAFPAKPEDADDDPHPWTLGKIWNMVPGGAPGRIYAGTMPGGLFRTDDRGDSWTLNEPLWTMPERKQWFGVAGGEMPGLSTVLIDPKNPDDIRVGVSCAGVWASTDCGASWANINEGMYNEYMPPNQRSEPIAQDIHQLAHCPGSPNVIWCQHHSGIYRSEDSGHNWIEIKSAEPSAFGFAVVAHPTDPKTAWFVPSDKDERRYPVDGKVVVSRTRDGGKSFDVLREGLPQRHAYDLVYRHALAVDDSGDRLAFGSTSGGVWVSEDGGDSWAALDARLPPVAAVRFAG